MPGAHDGAGHGNAIIVDNLCIRRSDSYRVFEKAALNAAQHSALSSIANSACRLEGRPLLGFCDAGNIIRMAPRNSRYSGPFTIPVCLITTDTEFAGHAKIEMPSNRSRKTQYVI
jgi:hypothetical protein